MNDQELVEWTKQFGCEVQIVRHVSDGPEYKDSIEIGTAGKGGAIKCYGDASKPAEFETRLKEMIRLRKVAQNEIAKEGS